VVFSNLHLLFTLALQIVTSDKDAAGCTAEKELADAEVVISQPFWPFYLTPERVAAAPKLKLAITAGW
jgi:formate dehydrogenase